MFRVRSKRIKNEMMQDSDILVVVTTYQNLYLHHFNVDINFRNHGFIFLALS
jgi:hypothetical protein